MDHSRSDEPQDPRPIVVTGASGFVGRHVVTALKASGVRFVCGTRDPERQRERDPSVLWRRIDLEEPETVRPALEGCRALVHLVHQIDAGSDYPEREERGARCIAEAAAAADLDRVVFLGGPDPGPNGSKHLHSRLRSGELLRQGDVPAVELRAAMIIGPGGISWDMVRGLAKKLPAMVLPRWAASCSVFCADDSSPQPPRPTAHPDTSNIATETPKNPWLFIAIPLDIKNRSASCDSCL